MKTTIYAAVFAVAFNHSGVASATATDFIDHGDYITDTTSGLD